MLGMSQHDPMYSKSQSSPVFSVVRILLDNSPKKESLSPKANQRQTIKENRVAAVL